jgi:hypothetical protein
MKAHQLSNHRWNPIALSCQDNAQLRIVRYHPFFVVVVMCWWGLGGERGMQPQSHRSSHLTIRRLSSPRVVCWQCSIFSLIQVGNSRGSGNVRKNEDHACSTILPAHCADNATQVVGVLAPLIAECLCWCCRCRCCRSQLPYHLTRRAGGVVRYRSVSQLIEPGESWE